MAADYYVDGIWSCELGINQGVSPLLLPRNQLADARDVTVRGTFVTHRPARRKIALTFDSPEIQSVVESGLWQGGAFYNSDLGTSSVMAAISGRLFQFQLGDTTATVSDRSIPGDYNPNNIPQAWLWQSENYLICNNGNDLPIFFDGLNSRRSYGPSVVLATTKVNFSAPNIASEVTVTLETAYTGQFNIPVLIGSATYQLLSTNSVYQATLTNISDTPTAIILASTNILNRPSVFGVISGTFSYGNFPLAPGTSLNFNLTMPYTGVVGDKFSLAGAIWTVTSILAGNGFTATNSITVNNVIVTDGQVLLRSPATAPSSTAATVDSAFAVPSKNATVTVNLTAPYVGAANAVVYIGNGQYKIVAVPAAAPGTSVKLINVDDTVGAVHLAPTKIYSIPELPAGRMGAYGMCRNWMSLVDGISFIAGDIVGGTAGTLTYSFRDAVLKISENTYLNGGGVFRVPGTVGDIRAMRFAATLDASLGQGPLQVYTPNTVFSCNTPVDRTIWQDVKNPILTESLIGSGAQGQHSTVLSNGDTFFRSTIGFGSLILGRRDFSTTWGNVPISREVSVTLGGDNLSLLPYGSAAVFDNRLLETCHPIQGPQGVYHDETVALNFDPVSSLGEKSRPVYDSVWTGLNVLQYLTGLYNGVQRCFAFVYNTDESKIELWEVLMTDAAIVDEGDERITWEFETCALFKEVAGKGVFDTCRLADGEMYVGDVQGEVDFEVYYKGDVSGPWNLWHSWSIPGTAPYVPNMGFGNPDATTCNSGLETPRRQGNTFQLKFVITGHCKFLGCKVKAAKVLDLQFAKPICSDT